MKIFFVTIIFVFGFSSAYTQSKIKFEPTIETGIAFRPGYIEMSNSSKIPGQPYTTYAYSKAKHFNNINLSIAIQQYILKNRISLQLASYFRYNHLYYGKNSQGISSASEKEFKRLKYDVFIDGLYHFKKRKINSIGFELGAGIGYMNFGTQFKDSAMVNNRYMEIKKGFRFLAPRLLIGVNKNNFSFFTIAHGTPDADYEPNPTIWLEFKLAYKFTPFKNN